MVPKFRVWETDRKAMHYTDKNLVVCFSDNGVDVIDHTTFSSSCMDIDNFELMQSTGLKDKNGLEIYKGDVVKVNNMKGLVKFGRYTDDEYIIYGLDGWLFSEIYHNRYIDTPLTEYVLDSDYEVEVIGNKYEHPHLLEE